MKDGGLDFVIVQKIGRSDPFGTGFFGVLTFLVI
jgi:hypothetical protein